MPQDIHAYAPGQGRSWKRGKCPGVEGKRIIITSFKLLGVDESRAHFTLVIGQTSYKLRAEGREFSPWEEIGRQDVEGTM